MTVYVREKPKWKLRMGNPATQWQHGVHKTQGEDKAKTTKQKSKKMNNTDTTKPANG